MISLPKPIEDWLNGQTGLELILTIAGIMAIIGLAWKFAKAAFPRVKMTIAFLDALGALPQFMADTRAQQESQDTLLQEIRHEVLPNNGGSLRDEVSTLSLRTEKVEAKLTKDHQRFSAIEDELRIREERGIGIPNPTSPRLKALPSRMGSTEPGDDDLGDTQQYPPPYPTPDEN